MLVINCSMVKGLTIDFHKSWDDPKFLLLPKCLNCHLLKMHRNYTTHMINYVACVVWSRMLFASVFLPATPRSGHRRYCFEVHSSVCLSVLCLLGICLQIVNSFSISGMDEAMLFKFGKWVEYGRVHPGGEKFPLKGVWSGSLDPFKNFKPLQYFWNGWSYTV